MSRAHFEVVIGCHFIECSLSSFTVPRPPTLFRTRCTLNECKSKCCTQSRNAACNIRKYPLKYVSYSYFIPTFCYGNWSGIKDRK